MLFNVIDGKDHIVGGEPLAIMPEDILSQLECISIISLHLPALGQSGDDALFVLPDQCVEDQAHPHISWAARVMAVGRGVAPVADIVGNGQHLAITAIVCLGGAKQ